MRTPSPPWVHVVRLMVPMSTCDEAATHLIAALGGEEMTKRIVGGTKWWQVRGMQGCVLSLAALSAARMNGFSSIDGEWIVAKKDWQEAKRRQKAMSAGAAADAQNQASAADSEYKAEMDQMRCILYAHGGVFRCLL